MCFAFFGAAESACLLSGTGAVDMPQLVPEDPLPGEFLLESGVFPPVFGVSTKGG